MNISIVLLPPVPIQAQYISFLLSGMYYDCDMSHAKFLGEK